MSKQTGVFLFFSITCVSLLLGTLLLRLSKRATPVPAPTLTALPCTSVNTSVSELRVYAIKHSLKFTVSHWPDGSYCVSLGNFTDTKRYRTNCEIDVESAAQFILNEIYSGKPAHYDVEEIETYTPPEEK